MHDDSHDNIFADDDALDFIIYDELENKGQERKNGKGGCLGVVVFTVITGSKYRASELEMLEQSLCG
jgi:hypothetical protein